MLDALAWFVATCPETQIPAGARDLARTTLLDAASVLIAGLPTSTSRVIREYVADSVGGPATVFGSDVGTHPELAALANGTSIHAMDFDDGSHPLRGHPSAHLWPALLALGEVLDYSLEDMVTAYLIGFEVDSALARALNPGHYEAGWHATSTIGSIGAAAACARLMGLSESVVKYTLGIAASHACGLRASFGSMTKPLHAGIAASAGVRAATLAAHGWTAGAGAIDGDSGYLRLFAGGKSIDAGPGAASLGTTWSILNGAGLSIKRFACCGALHPAIEAAIEIHGQLAGHAVSEVVVGMSRAAQHILRGGIPGSPDEARFSPRYVVAVALARGAVRLSDFSEAGLGQEGIQALMSKTVVRTLPRFDLTTDFPAVVTVTTDGGLVLDHQVDVARGKNRRPLTRGELRQKFDDCTGRTSASHRLWNLVRRSKRDVRAAELTRSIQSAALAWADPLG